MATIVNENFEGDLSKWGLWNTPELQNAIVRSGLKALKCKPYDQAFLTISSPPPKIYSEAYVYYETALPGPDTKKVNLLHIQGAEYSNLVDVSLYKDDPAFPVTLLVWSPLGSPKYVDADQLQPGAFNKVGVEYICGVDGGWRVFVNGVEVATVPGVNTASHPLKYVFAGTSNYSNVYTDDVLVTDGLPTSPKVALAFNSTPISVELTFDSQKLRSGQSVLLDPGQLSVSLPGRVTVDETVGKTLGVIFPYWNETDRNAAKPDIWTLMDYMKATLVSGTGGIPLSFANEALANNKKVMPSYSPSFLSPDNPGPFTSYQNVENHFSNYNVSQFRNHAGIAGHILTGEPLIMYRFDPRSPPQNVITFIDNIKHGCDFLRAQDPTHPVWVALTSPSAFYQTDRVLWTQVQKAFIKLFIPFCDVLDYHMYYTGDYQHEFWRNVAWWTEQFRTDCDDVCIPVAQEYGKHFFIGETGCYSRDGKDYLNRDIFFTEQQQIDYFTMIGSISKPRNIPIHVFRSHDPPGSGDSYGMFAAEIVNGMNKPKPAASMVYDALAVNNII